MVEREWREARDLRTSRLALSLVLIAAAVLGFWALGRGIPYAVQVDEPEIVERAVGMMRSGSLHQYFFDYPALYIYLQLSVAVVLLACWMTVPLRGGAWAWRLARPPDAVRRSSSALHIRCWICPAS